MGSAAYITAVSLRFNSFKYMSDWSKWVQASRTATCLEGISVRGKDKSKLFDWRLSHLWGKKAGLKPGKSTGKLAMFITANWGSGRLTMLTMGPDSLLPNLSHLREPPFNEVAVTIEVARVREKQHSRQSSCTHVAEAWRRVDTN